LALLKTGALQAGETVFVNVAAGAVGHIVGQLCKIKASMNEVETAEYYTKILQNTVIQKIS